MDETGDPHVVFFEFNSNVRFLYAKRKEGLWSLETAVPDPGQHACGVDLILDADGNAIMTYLSEEELGLVVLTNRTGSWESTVVDTFDEMEWNGTTSIALDPEGSAHVSYVSSNLTGPTLKYATDMSGEWVTTTIDQGMAGRYNSLALDSSGTVHVAYDAEKALWRAVFPVGYNGE